MEYISADKILEILNRKLISLDNENNPFVWNENFQARLSGKLTLIYELKREFLNEQTKTNKN